ncbi:MAG: hypothetical protein U5O16_33870 [Rhodococcus sp. (in: high G+C Gram-positive bacteria)]|nr:MULTISPECIES: hypothetical protein [Rhodococcus erythropolis group]MCZ4528026.1 hypothetical protein [Rhodococcus erythropolis]MDZ7916765.1 hypothetical protein [Rhodococcus sp. (in: high G+C Gram-positive bacteria)]
MRSGGFKRALRSIVAASVAVVGLAVSFQFDYQGGSDFEVVGPTS